MKPILVTVTNHQVRDNQELPLIFVKALEAFTTFHPNAILWLDWEGGLMKIRKFVSVHAGGKTYLSDREIAGIFYATMHNMGDDRELYDFITL